MTLALLALTPAAVREALERRGMDVVRAEAAARGLTPAAFILEPLDEQRRDAVALAAHEQSLACLTGDGWALVAGPAAQLAGLVRPGLSRLEAGLADDLGRALQGFTQPPESWETARGEIALSAPVVVGILNITPDSFSDGGAYMAPAAALAHAESMVAAGAAMLDVGAESTRPGNYDSVSAEDEWHRLENVLPELVRRYPALPISVDTAKAETARRAVDAGAWVINDVGGLRLDPAIADVCAGSGAGLVLMHSRGTLSEIASYDHAAYDDLVAEVASELQASVRQAEDHGVTAAHIVIDPGLGFAKRPEHNFSMLRGLPALCALGRPIMVGPSRKRFLGAVTGKAPQDRDAATAAACVAAYDGGARLFRVHGVAEIREALTVAHTIRAS